jgi:protein gp37
MADKTSIEWADATLNYVNGCTVTSPGCKLCYAMKQAHRFDIRRGLTKMTNGGMVWTGEIRLNENALQQALRWQRPRKIFWNAHGDLFHENVPDRATDSGEGASAVLSTHPVAADALPLRHTVAGSTRT